MKITSPNNSGSNLNSGYTWIINENACEGVIEIESGYEEPEDLSGFDIGYGEYTFTITAKEYGSCDFKIAYSRAWEFTSFEDYTNKGGQIISIPIRVV